MSKKADYFYQKWYKKIGHEKYMDLGGDIIPFVMQAYADQELENFKKELIEKINYYPEHYLLDEYLFEIIKTTKPCQN